MGGNFDWVVVNTIYNSTYRSWSRHTHGQYIQEVCRVVFFIISVSVILEY